MLYDGSMKQWSADILTDPSRGHRLHIELMCDEECVGRLFFDDDFKLQLWIYGNDGVTVPMDWLLRIAESFKAEGEDNRETGAY
ncbi:MAG TPA: hypothetical protein VGB55_02770 [Tepidisphaeraceae bacterium]|jgi:hypothetical protein